MDAFASFSHPGILEQSAGLHNHSIINTIDTNGTPTTEDGTDKNLPPYFVTYIWERTA